MIVTTSSEIELNGQKYRIKGAVSGSWVDPFPEAFTLGDADYANRRDLSSWIMQNFSGGIGVEEMDEKKDWNKCWWTNCIIKFRNHILPPRLATQINKKYTWTSPTGFVDGATAWTDEAKVYDNNLNTYAYTTSTVPATSWSNYLEFTYSSSAIGGIRYLIDSSDDIAGQANAYITKIDIDVYYSGAWHDVYEGTVKTDAWHTILTEQSGVTAVRIRLYNGDASSKYVAIAELDFAIQSTGTEGGELFANFNGNLYKAKTDTLYCLNSNRDGFVPIYTFSSNITALISSLNSRLYIYIGDTTNYWWMSTFNALTETAADLKDLTADAGTDADTIVDAALSGKSILKGDYVYNTTRSAGAYVKSFSGTTIELESVIASQASGDTYSVRRGANWGFQYDAKLFRVNTKGVVTYSTDPDDAAPTWTSAGAITDIADQIEGFVVGRDASGNYVPYAATNSIIKAYDSATPQWIDTEARLPNHPIGGQGHTYWNGKLYFSYGLGVKEYYPETGAFLDVGLTERDGLPVEYNGEVTKLYGDTGVKGMFTSVDASVTSGNSKSGLYLFDGYGWQCWWADTANNGAMHDIIVSSASSGYAVYWDVGGVIYYIDIPRGIENPDKISQSYATAGIFLSPWFDAGNPVAAKLAKVLEDFAKGITTTETVALKYRLDHTYTDLDTGWTTMDTLNTTAESGHNEELFASGAGISYKAIQFRLDFVTPGATAKPDIQSLALYFKKRTGSEKLRVWTVTVICDNYALTTAKQKTANLKAAIESTTDVLFSYHPNDASTESFYVTVNCNEFSEQTGRDYEANYSLQLIES